MAELGPALEALYGGMDVERALARDPVRFVRRYVEPADIEIAGVFASQLAYGRVDLFGPVLGRLFDTFDSEGGPRAFVDGFGPGMAERLLPLVYRWNRGPDWIAFCGALQRLTRAHGSLESVFVGDDARQSLSVGVGRLRTEVASVVPDGPGRGLKHWLSSPVSGSACKRWNLFLRWMVRPTSEGIDLGIWKRPGPAGLVVPLDTHVHRVARFLGLTGRGTASWAAAEEVTAALAAFDPQDPVRFDFALAHLGISGSCLGHRDAEVCSGCPLDPLCRAPIGPGAQ